MDIKVDEDVFGFIRLLYLSWLYGVRMNKLSR